MTQIVASNTIKYSNDTLVDCCQLDTYGIIKSITMTDSYTGSWKINFDAAGDLDEFDHPSTANLIIRKNGVNYGTAQSTSSSSFVTFTQTFTSISINNGDTMELWGFDTTSTLATRNFRIMFDIVPGVQATLMRFMT
jgi:hypothetical protein